MAVAFLDAIGPHSLRHLLPGQPDVIRGHFGANPLLPLALTALQNPDVPANDRLNRWPTHCAAALLTYSPS
jgi:hypothetical protein